MPKMKTHKGVAKRIRVTGSGKLRHGRARRRHLMTSKSAKRSRDMRRPALIDPVNEAQIRRLLPYA